MLSFAGYCQALSITYLGHNNRYQGHNNKYLGHMISGSENCRVEILESVCARRAPTLCVCVCVCVCVVCECVWCVKERECVCVCGVVCERECVVWYVRERVCGV